MVPEHGLPDTSSSGPAVADEQQADNLLVRILKFIRFSHTVFALPFALGAMFVAADCWPGGWVFMLVLVAMVCARSAAMAFNRVADWEIDKKNPRTAARHKLVSRPVAIALIVVASAGFTLAAYLLNPLCFALSPVALFFILFYSLTKRFTSLAHFFLGLALAISPVGGWLAVTGAFSLPPLVLAVAVLLWVAGFDLIYALLDREFDRQAGLHSMAARMPAGKVLMLSRLLHLGAFLGLLAFGYTAGLDLPYFLAMAAIAVTLCLEHFNLDPANQASLQKAFFRDNAIVGLIFFCGCLLAVFLR